MNRKNVIAAVWLIGLGLLFMVDYIWPGILILIGITMIVNATMHEEPTVLPPTAPTPLAEPVEARAADTLRRAQGTTTSPMVEPVEARVAGTLRQAQGTAPNPLAEPVEARISDTLASASSATATLGESLPAVLASEAERLYLASKLPENCPACGAPMRANAEKLAWHEDNSLSCGFCGYRLTIKTD